MEFESTNSGTTAKLPILKLGEYEMWVIRIKQYFQIQDYALWDVIENGNSWVSVPQTAQENCRPGLNKENIRELPHMQLHQPIHELGVVSHSIDDAEFVLLSQSPPPTARTP
ncbi:hypothetical protein Tco_0052418 [Tanacetum coccineum]